MFKKSELHPQDLKKILAHADPRRDVGTWKYAEAMLLRSKFGAPDDVPLYYPDEGEDPAGIPTDGFKVVATSIHDSEFVVFRDQEIVGAYYASHRGSEFQAGAVVITPTGVEMLVCTNMDEAPDWKHCSPFYAGAQVAQDGMNKMFLMAGGGLFEARPGFWLTNAISGELN